MWHPHIVRVCVCVYVCVCVCLVWRMIVERRKERRSRIIDH